VGPVRHGCKHEGHAGAKQPQPCHRGAQRQGVAKLGGKQGAQVGAKVEQGTGHGLRARRRGSGGGSRWPGARVRVMCAVGARAGGAIP